MSFSTDEVPLGEVLQKLAQCIYQTQLGNGTPRRHGVKTLEELSVRENVLLPTVLAGRRRPEADAQRWLDGLGLAAVADRPATAASLGEQQRAALARALVLRPRLAVLDEPTGHQDDANVALVLQMLAAARDEGTTVLIATHDDRVLAVADQVVELRGGRVVAD